MSCVRLMRMPRSSNWRDDCLRPVGRIQIHAQHQTHAANFADALVLGFETFEFGVEVVAGLADVSQHAIEHAQKFDCHGAGQRSAAEGGAVHSGMHAAGHAIGGQQRSQRKPCRQRLGDGDDVGLNSVMLVGEILSGTAQSALDFVENQQRSGALAQLPRGLQKFRTERTDSAFALNGLQANGADAAIKLPLEIVDIVEADKPDSRHQRRKRMPIFFLPRGGQRAKGAAMKGILQRQQTPLGFVAVVVLGAGKGARQLERAFPGFGAAVAEEMPCPSRKSWSAASPVPPGTRGRIRFDT